MKIITAVFSALVVLSLLAAARPQGLRASRCPPTSRRCWPKRGARMSS